MFWTAPGDYTSTVDEMPGSSYFYLLRTATSGKRWMPQGQGADRKSKTRKENIKMDTQQQKEHHAVVITGADSDIGAACALSLDRLGWRVFAGVHHYRESDDLKQHASECVNEERSGDEPLLKRRT